MERTYPKTYAVKHKNDAVRAKSRSGGVFTALSDEILKQNGVVYGCVLNEKFEAEHIRATTAEERDKMRGSKYIQSKMGSCYLQVKKDLENERKVLFSGTSCQISGLKSYLKKEYFNLICVDIVCHGVPSTKVWKKYLDWCLKKHKGKIIDVDFRNKRDFGWAAHIETVWIKSKKRITQIDSRVFRKLFYGHNILRPSCYKCPYKSIERISDITIADYWGIDKAAVAFNDNKGVSLVLVNNEKGMQIFNAIVPSIITKETDIRYSMQNPLVKPEVCPKTRQEFWLDFNNKSFDEIVKKYAQYNLKEQIKDKIKKIIYGRKY